MSKLRVFNPVRDAVNNSRALSRINSGIEKRTATPICWNCMTEKDAKGGTFFGAKFSTVTRFKCAECCEKSKK